MKFSYTLIKKLVPQLKSKNQLIEALNLHAFEAENLAGDVFDVKLPPNRYSDAASHWGIAREAAAILNLKVKLPARNTIRESDFSKFKIKVLDKNLCPRYSAQYFENIIVKSSPEWMQKILTDCGLRPVSNVVDVMNYVMLETGQPLHAFDYDKLEGKGLIIRRAKKSEIITSIDNVRYKLNPSMLVIADLRRPQAIAGIKGGKSAEVTSRTKRIIVESANFESVGIYKTSRALKLFTDASSRFSHDLSPHLTLIGLERAASLLNEIIGARAGAGFDTLTKPISKKIIKFNIEEFNRFIGSNLDLKTTVGYLKRLGFVFKDGKFEAPPTRQDIETHEDLAEEIIRLYGLNNLKSQPPQVALRPGESEETFLFKDKIRKFLVGVGLSEVYNHSFVSEGDVKRFDFKEARPLENPISGEFSYLRPSLVPGFLKNLESNSKNSKEIKIFEIGRVFLDFNKKLSEIDVLSIALASKDKKVFFELKGLLSQFFESLGLVDYREVQPKKSDWVSTFVKEYVVSETLLEVKSENSGFAYLGIFSPKASVLEERDLGEWHIALFEADLGRVLQFVEEEKEYEPFSRYPSVMRDISILVNIDRRIGDVVEAIQNSNPHLVQDVDLIDEYIDDKWDKMQSLTFRIVFGSDDRTLTNEEVDKEMKKIIALLENKFEAQIR